MGRLYKTASASPLDYMYRINVPLMKEVIMQNDQYINQNLAQLDAANNLAASFGYLQPDESRAKEITESYSKKIDELTDAIRKDPANWRKQFDPIRNLSRDLMQDYKTGEISKISGNYSQYKKVADNIDKQIEEFNKTGKGISADRAKAYKSYFLQKFVEANPKGTAYNPQTGEYNAIRVFDPMANIDIRKTLSEDLDKIKSDANTSIKEELTANGAYFNKTTNKWEGITEDKILSIAMSRLNNPQLIQYLKQDSDIGLIKGVYDDKGQFISPYGYAKTPMSEQEELAIARAEARIASTKDPRERQTLQENLESYQRQLSNRTHREWNPNSYLAPILQGISREFSHNRVETGNDMSNNSLYNTMYSERQANARNSANIASREKMHRETQAGINQRFVEELKLGYAKLDLDKYKWDNPHTKDGKGSASKNTAKDKDKDKDGKPIVETTIDRSGTNSFEDLLIENSAGKKVPLLSIDGLSSGIDQNKRQLSEIDSQLSQLNKALTIKPNPTNANAVMEYNKLKLQKQNLELQRKKVDADLGQIREWYRLTDEAVLSNHEKAGTKLSPDEIKLYREFSNDKDGKKYFKYIEDLTKKYPDRLDPNVGASRAVDGGGKMIESPQVQAARAKWKQYREVKEKVDENRDTFLKELRKSYIDSDAIVPNEKESEELKSMILSNPQGLVLYNDNGTRADDVLDGKGISLFAPKADDYSLSFEGNKNFSKYIQDYGGDFRVERVGTTTAIGRGNAVMKITMTKDPSGNLPQGKVFYIEATPEMQRTLSSKFSKHKNPDVSKVAQDMGDSFSNDIRRQIAMPHADLVANKESKKTIFVKDNQGGTIPMEVTRLEGGNLQVKVELKDGTVVPFPNRNGVPGFFQGTEDFIQNLKLGKQ